MSSVIENKNTDWMDARTQLVSRGACAMIRCMAFKNEKAASRAGMKGAKAQLKTLTPEETKERARLAARARWISSEQEAEEEWMKIAELAHEQQKAWGKIRKRATAAAVRWRRRGQQKAKEE